MAYTTNNLIPKTTWEQKQRWPPKCWNCGGIGHKQEQCPSPLHDNMRQPSTNGRNSGGETANEAKAVGPTQHPLCFDVGESRTHLKRPNGACESHSIVEVYNSSTTHHLTPYRHLFVTFRPIPAKHLRAANQMTF